MPKAGKMGLLIGWNMKKLNSRSFVAAVSAGALVAGGMVVPANAQSSDSANLATESVAPSGARVK